MGIVDQIKYFFFKDAFAAIFSDKPPPPTSKKFLEEDMEEKMIRKECEYLSFSITECHHFTKYIWF